jgi:hypothetical protein
MLGTEQRPFSKEVMLLPLSWVLCSAIILFNILNHGMWLDETHAWCIVRDSASFVDLRWNMRNEGHPWLWHVMLWPLAKSGAPVWSMQVLNGCISVFTFTILLFRSPFPVIVRVLVVFGYFLVFEYAALARNYAIGILLVLLAVDLHHKGRVQSSFILFLLLPQVHLWSACLVASWAIVDVLQPRLFLRWQSALLLLSSCVALYCVLPADTLPHGADPSRLWRMDTYRATAIQLTKAVVPIADPGAAHVWNSSVLVSGENALARWTGPLALVTLAFLLPVRTRGRVMFVVGSAAVLALPLLAPFYSQRYVGPLLAIALACAWLWPAEKAGRTVLAGAFIITLLLVQVAGGVYMSYLTALRPFSNSRSAAASCDGANGPVLVMRYDAAPSISAYLGEPVHLVFRQEMGSFCIWNDPRSIATEEDLVLTLQRMAPRRAQVISDTALDQQTLAKAGYRVLAMRSFTGSMLRREDHVVMTLERVTDLHPTE